MKKISNIVKEKTEFEMHVLINNTALIESKSGKTGLLNIKTNQIIGKFDDYYTIYSTDRQFYIQEKVIEDSSVPRWNERKVINIYDAKNEKMLVEGLEEIASYESGNFKLLKSLVDGKVYIFDRNTCRQEENILNTAFDSVEFLYEKYGKLYLLVEQNGKKGIYKCAHGLITNIEFDNIEKQDFIVIFEKNNQKCFVCDDKEDEMSLDFDDIKVDEHKKNIVYCKKGNRFYVYNSKSHELLLNEECDDIKYIGYNGENIYDHIYGDFYFASIKNNLKGLLVSNTVYNNQQKNTEQTKLLDENYDDIEFKYGIVYTKKNGKVGLFKHCRNENVSVEPDYEKIEELGHDMYAFYYDGRCDIYKIVKSLDLLIKNCNIVSSQNHAYIFEQNNSYGILYQGLRVPYRGDEDVIVDNNDNVEYLDHGHYEVERNGKKGVNFRGKEIIPLEYDSIDLKLYKKRFDNQTIYFSLGKKDIGFELAKKRYWEYHDSDVEFMEGKKFEEINFFDDIIALRTKTNLLIYDYEERLLKQLSETSQISMVYKKPDSNYDKQPMYNIDGDFYYYQDGKFEEILTEEIDLYITTYETKNDSFEIRTFNKKELDSFCSIIDSQEESIAEQSLIDIFENVSNDVRRKHQNLVLTRVKK